MLYPVCVHILGIAITGASDISTDLASSNQITDYSFVTQPFTLDPFNVILRCATGLGPSGSDSNTILGGWYFNGAQLFAPSGDTFCEGIVFEVRGANSRRHPGVINLYLRGTFATTEEGVYSCIMMNSSMMNQTIRVGVYLNGRSKSLDMYPITSCQGELSVAPTRHRVTCGSKSRGLGLEGFFPSFFGPFIFYVICPKIWS